MSVHVIFYRYALNGMMNGTIFLYINHNHIQNRGRHKSRD